MTSFRAERGERKMTRDWDNPRPAPRPPEGGGLVEQLILRAKEFRALKRTEYAEFDAKLDCDAADALTAAQERAEKAESERADALAIIATTERHGSVYAAVERVLDKRSAWISRPDHETTLRVALAATIAANELLGNPSGKLADAQLALERAEIQRDGAVTERDEARAALARAREAMERLLSDIEGLIADSQGVYGLHLNGDPAPWDELLPGGRFEWLSSLDDAREALTTPAPADGWRLVPVEPTPEMRAAIFEAVAANVTVDDGGGIIIESYVELAAWRKAIAASPKGSE